MLMRKDDALLDAFDCREMHVTTTDPYDEVRVSNIAWLWLLMCADTCKFPLWRVLAERLDKKKTRKIGGGLLGANTHDKTVDQREAPRTATQERNRHTHICPVSFSNSTTLCFLSLLLFHYYFSSFPLCPFFLVSF